MKTRKPLPRAAPVTAIFVYLLSSTVYLTDIYIYIWGSAYFFLENFK